MTLLCVGVSVRPIVESAVRGGAEVFAVDYFGDLDTASACPGTFLRSGGSEFPPRSRDYLNACLKAGCDSFLYTAPLENHPSLISKLSKKMRLRGTAAGALHTVRDPTVLSDFCTREGIRFPEIRLVPPPSTHRRWLLKPRMSGGGMRVGFFGGRLLKESYLQEYVDGTPCSVTFLADGHEARLVSATRQLVGEEWLGASGFLWCGNVVPYAMGKRHARTLSRICNKLTRTFSLVGCMGADFILSDDIHLLEVNPRLCGSMDAVEGAFDMNLFDLHMDACEGSLANDFQAQRHCAKAILYAERDVLPRGTQNLFGTAIRDIPQPGIAIHRGEPLCSVIAKGETETSALENLGREVGKVKRFFYG